MRRSLVRLGLSSALVAPWALGCGSQPAPVSAPVEEPPPFEQSLTEVRRVIQRWQDDDDAFHRTAIEDPSGHALDHFRGALERTAEGERSTHVIVYGGSHTAADLYPGVLRRAFQSGFGDLGHGFVMPVPPFENYWQDGVRVFTSEGFAALEPAPKRRGPDDYGLAGMAFDADGEALAELETDGTRASRIDVFYLAQPGGGGFQVDVDGRVTVVSTASAEPHAAVETIATEDAHHHVRIETNGDGPVRLFGVALGREGTGVVVDQLGLAGAKARHQLLWTQPVWQPLLGSRMPDLILLSYGNNETTERDVPIAQHEGHFVDMLARMRAAFPEVSCLVIGPFDRLGANDAQSATISVMVEQLRDAQRRAALDAGCGFFDSLAWMGGPGSMRALLDADPPLARRDGVHFTERTYRRLGAEIVRALLEALEARPRP